MAHLLLIDLPGGNDTDVIDAVCRAGHRYTFLSSDLALYQRQPAVRQALASAGACLEVPGFADDDVERAVLALHARDPLDGLLCLIDIRLVAAARLARRLGLRFLDPERARLLRDKVAVRQHLRAQGILQPAFALARSNDELRSAVEAVGFPALVKPADGYGSQNIVVLRAPDDLACWYAPGHAMLPSGANYGLGVRANDRLLVERYMTGTLIGCDTFSADGRHEVLGIYEKLMFEPPSFAIRGSTFMTDHPAMPLLRPYVQALLDAVGFDWGATHIELMLTDDGPRLVEINARLVGAKMPRLAGAALGRNLYLDLIALHLGRLDLEALRPATPGCAAVRWVTADDYGVLQALEWPRWHDSQVHCAEQVCACGQEVGPPFENADRLAYVMTRGDTREQAEDLAERCVADTRLQIIAPIERAA